MKIKVPSKEIEVCDVCRNNGGYLQTCDSCGRQYCFSCDGKTICGCVHSLDICRPCSNQPEVLAIAKEFAPPLMKVLGARCKKLKALRPTMKRRYAKERP